MEAEEGPWLRILNALNNGEPASDALAQYYVESRPWQQSLIMRQAGLRLHFEALEWLWRHHSATTAATNVLVNQLLNAAATLRPRLIAEGEHLSLLDWIEAKKPDISSWRGENIWVLLDPSRGVACRWFAERTDLQALAMRNLDSAPSHWHLWPRVIKILRGLGPNPELDMGLLRTAAVGRRGDVVQSFIDEFGADTVRAICLADVGEALRRAKKPTKPMAKILLKIKMARSDFAGIGIPRDRAELWLRAMASAAKPL
jgi:hypothetical protein